MVQQHVAGANGGEDVAFHQLEPRRGHEGRIAQVGPLEPRKRHQRMRPQGRRALVEIAGPQLQLVEQEAPDGLRSPGIDLQSHHVPEAAPPHLTVDHLQEVVHLGLEKRNVHVPGDAEGVDADDAHPGEERVEVGRDQVLQEHESIAAHRHEARQALGDLDAREPPLAVVGILHLHRQRKGEIGDEGKRMAGVHGQGRQDGEDVGVVVVRGLGQGVGGRGPVAAQPDAGALQRREELSGEERGGGAQQSPHGAPDLLQLFAGGEPFGSRLDLAHLQPRV